MKLLIPEPPLQVLPSLAVEIGLNEAILVQQVHFWHVSTGSEWVYNTLENWQSQFPFWSDRTLQRAISGAKKSGYLLVEQRGGQVRTNHYRVNYDRVSMTPDCRLEDATLSSSPYNRESTEKEKASEKKKETGPTAEVLHVFEHWQKVLDRGRSRLTPARRKKIEARLKDYSVADVIRAIDGCAGSDWHRENALTDLTLILRNEENIERFMKMPKPADGGDEDYFAGTEFGS